MEEKILELFQNRRFAELKALLKDQNPADVALIFEEVPKRDMPVLFRLLPKELAAETFVEMDSDEQEFLISAFSDNELKAVLDELFVDDTVDIIEEMPATVAKRIIRQSDSQTRAMINQILAYPDDSAGSIMTTEYVDLKKDMTVAESFDRIRKIGMDKETIYNCYVTDRNRKLLGLVTVKQLLLTDRDTLLDDIMETSVISVSTSEDKETVAQMFDKYDFLAIPVVDHENRLVGIVTVDDAMDVLQDEVTEDIARMAAITSADKPYLKTGVFETWGSRIPWLLLLMISATFTGFIISGFEESLTGNPLYGIALTCFMPMIMGTAGNSGSQASVTIIRALSLGDVKFSDMFRILWKEFRVSILCGISLALANFVKVLLFDNLLLGMNYDLMVIAVICISLAVTVVIAKLVGCSLPLLAKKIGFDPAVMASPFITTIVDALSLFIYFDFAKHILQI